MKWEGNPGWADANLRGSGEISGSGGTIPADGAGDSKLRRLQT
jgi:hypothetical protein